MAFSNLFKIAQSIKRMNGSEPIIIATPCYDHNYTSFDKAHLPI